MWELLIVLITLFIGSFIQGASGFGFGLFSMGFLPLFLTLKESTLLIVALSAMISIKVIAKHYRYIDWKELRPILIIALLGRIFSFPFLTFFGEMEFMKLILGYVLIGMVVYMHILEKKDLSNSLIKKRYVGLIISFIGGFIGGVFAVGGPFYVFYFLIRYEEKENYIANLQTTFLFTNSFTLLLHSVNGDITFSLFKYILLGGIVVFFSVHLGLKWFEKLPRDKIQKIATVIILISGINLIFISL